MQTLRLLSILILPFLYSCSKLVEPEFKAIDRFKIITLGLDEVRIGFGITYFNPNDFSVSVKETGADVYLDSVFLGKFVQDSIVMVGRDEDFTVPLSGSISMATFFRLDLKEIHKRTVSIRADGSTKVGKAGIFITKKIAYQGRHRLDQIRL